jgi:hypothetical protein
MSGGGVRAQRSLLVASCRVCDVANSETPATLHNMIALEARRQVAVIDGETGTKDILTR